MNRGAWQAMVHGVPKNQTWLNDSHTYLHAHMHACVHPLCTHVHIVLQACYWVMPKYTVVWVGETGELRDSCICSISSCRFHLPSTLNTKTLGSSWEVSIYARVPCPTGHQDLGEKINSVQCMSFLRAGESAARLRPPWVSAKLIVSLLFSLPFLWIQRILVSWAVSLFFSKHQKKKKKNPQQSRKEEGRNEVDHSQKANIRQSKLGGIYPAMKGKNTGGEKWFYRLKCAVTEW